MREDTHRAEQARETKEALIVAGLDLFGASGFTEVSAQQIVARAGVTRGALYHHFTAGKRGLFEAVVERLLGNLVAGMGAAVAEGITGWSDIQTVLGAYFDATMTRNYRQIALQDAPAVLGNGPFRAMEYTYSVSFMRTSLAQLVDHNILRPTNLESLAILIFGACCEATLAIAEAEDYEAAKVQTIETLLEMLEGLRAESSFAHRDSPR